MAGLWQRLSGAAWLAALGFLAAVPYAYYVAKVAFPDRMRERFGGLSPERVLEADLVTLALLASLAALAGSLFSARYRLGGVGTREGLRAELRWLVPAGLVLAAATHLLIAAPIRARVPDYYPAVAGWALAMWAKNVFFDELVARFGMMTILAGVAPRWLANALQALFFTAVGYKAALFFGLDLTPRLELYLGTALAFVVHLTLGAAYARAGLAGALLLRAIIDVKLLLYPIS